MSETPRPPANDEFYIGYLPSPPPGVARRIRRAVGALLAGAAALAALLAAAQRPFAPAVFEFGQPREFSGRLAAQPVPLLWLLRPGRTGAVAKPLSGYLLVGPGKHGAEALVAGLAGRAVRLRGSLVYRQGATMIEVVPGTLQASPAEEPLFPPVPRPEPQGTISLRGEIVDGKCFLGVMNPGSGKPHRDCAVRCLSGGAPPLLLVREASGAARTVLLIGPRGRAIGREMLDVVAEPVAVHGELARHGELHVLVVERSDIRRLGRHTSP